MKEPGAFGRFVEQNPRFAFDLIEHVQAAAVIEDARKSFEAFAAGVGLDHGRRPWTRLRQAIRAAAALVPAYAGVEWDRADYEATIPLIDKYALRTRSEAFLRPGLAKESLWTRPTSGTSGPPVTVYYDATSFAELQYFSACAALCYAGLLPGILDDRPIFTLTILDNSYLNDRIWTDPSCLTGATLRVVFDTLSLSASEDIAELVRRHRPAVLSLKPNILHILLEQLDGRAPRLADGPVAIISGGAELPEPLRLEAQERIGLPIVNAYGLSETGGVASSCCGGPGLHIHEGALICEVLAADGALGWTGEGELVLSSVRNRAMPILRYRTGDFAAVTDEPCPCGLPGRRILRLTGRQAPSFPLAGGGYFAPTNLNQLFGAFPLRELQVTQLALDRAELRVEFLDPSGAYLLDEVRSAAQRIVEGRFELEVAVAVFQPGAKFQRYRTLIAADAPPSGGTGVKT
ncbi:MULTISPECIES: phenylacetate--CoA ligase family protein [unclassified Phenylobacterium]|uniref:phenylacetate--CoA ligase family protein n=1 Tax=unclassified Phenylobacterium TaxID=2640670 RepID=UPI00083AC838|nr:MULTISPECIES: AMP-binding protein [unclassified Phenylobacterium]